MSVSTATEPLEDFILIPIEDIDPGERYRQNPERELDKLAESIDSIGLLNPVVVMPRNGDGKHALVAGQRRMLAYSQLGMTDIEAHIVHDLDEANKLLAEQDENTCRLPMTPAEVRALVKARLAIEKEASKQNQVEGPKRAATERKRAPGGKFEKTQVTTTDGNLEKPKRKRGKTAIQKATEGTNISAATYERMTKIEHYRDNEDLPSEIRELAAAQLNAVDNADAPVDAALRIVENAKRKWEREQSRPEPEPVIIEEPDGTVVVSDPPPENRGQTLALNNAMIHLKEAAELLEGAFKDADNFDPDTDVDSINAAWTDIRKLVARINAVSKDVKAMAA